MKKTLLRLKYRLAKYWMSSRPDSTVSSFSGSSSISSRTRRRSSPSREPRTFAIYSPSRSSTASWVVYALVVATAISGPAQVYSTWSLSLAMEEPTTLTMDRIFAPSRLASRSAAMVSSVSPDWLMTTTRVCSSTMGSMYRNSDARATSTGTRRIRSRLYLPTMPTW